MTSTDTLTSTRRVDVANVGMVEVTLTERGQGHTFLLLHGGGGPQTVTGFADLLAATREAPRYCSHPPRLRRHRAPRSPGYHPGPGHAVCRLARRTATFSM